MHIVRLLLSVCVVFVLSCGGGNPAGPSDTSGSGPHGTNLSIISAKTNQPIAGAKVLFQGKEYISGSNGMVMIEGLASKSPLDVSADGYVTREVAYTKSTIDLVPNEGGFDQAFLDAVVFGGNQYSRLFKVMNPAGITIVFSAGMDDESIVNAHTAAAEMATAATGGKIRFSVNDPNKNKMVQVKVNLVPGLCPVPSNNVLNGTAGAPETSGADINYCSKAYASNAALALHELMHVIGVGGHHSRPTGIMRWPWLVNSTEILDDESLAIRYAIELRRPGSCMPDRDPERCPPL